ncbi:MAG TPA: hypothetical protein VMW72_14210 [Sedimentisphaerales bacterium]|nr:hypothetical protein [Sedimentisphaerales bacterium]
MNEIKETIAILRARWPEVTFIIGLSVLSLFVNKLHLIAATRSTMFESLLGLGYLLLLFIINVMNLLLTIGFQKTIHLTGKQRKSPMVLLRTGRHFLGRMVKVGLILIPIYFLLIWLTFLIVKKATFIDTNFFKTAQSSPFLYQLCFAVPGFILIKPMLLMPTLIIVLDCQVFQSFKFLKKIKLFDAKELLALFLITTISTFSWAILPKLNEPISTWQFALIIFFSTLTRFLGLMVAVTAIRFVSSLNLEYDSITKDLNSENLLKPSVED